MSTSSGDDDMNSSGTPGTLSPAEALTISRYSSRAMSSSYMCSSAGTGRDTGTSATSTRSDIDVADDDDVSKFRSNTDILRSSGSRYFTPSASDVYSSTADDLTTSSSSSNGSGGRSSSNCNNPHGPDVSREGANEWQRGIQRRAGQRRTVGRVTLAPCDDGANDERLDNDDGGTGVAANTSRTCSNELLNVISIDDDKLRYRHYSGNNNNNNNNKATLMITKPTGTYC